VLPFVGTERSLVLARAGRQRVGEGGRPGDSQAGSLAEQRHARRGVPQQRDPPPGPGPQPHLADGVEVKVRSRADLLEQVRHPPASARVGLGQDSLVLTRVAVVESSHLRATEDERGQRLAAHRVDGDGLSRRVVHEHVGRVHPEIVQRHRGDIEPHMLHKVPLGAERQPPHRRMQPVGPDDQVEPARGGTLERHVHAAVILREADDGVVKQELGHLAAGLKPCRLKQRRCQLAARYLHLTAGRRPSQRLQVDPPGPAPRRVEEAQRPHPGGGRPQPRHDPHSFGHRHGGAPHVHRAPARPLPSRALHDRYREPAPGQPVRQRRPGDAGPRDQHRLLAHQ
jgi:hypothetical protein